MTSLEDDRDDKADNLVSNYHNIYYHEGFNLSVPVLWVFVLSWSV